MNANLEYHQQIIVKLIFKHFIKYEKNFINLQNF